MDAEEGSATSSWGSKELSLKWHGHPMKFTLIYRLYLDSQIVSSPTTFTCQSKKHQQSSLDAHQLWPRQ